MIADHIETAGMLRVVYRRSRALDWMCAAMILVWGLTLALPGQSFSLSALQRVMHGEFSEDFWATVLILLGLMRVAALLINGHMPRGSPVLRLISAFIGVLVWSYFLELFVELWVATGIIATGCGVSAVLVGADLFSTGRAAADFMRARHVHRG